MKTEGLGIGKRSFARDNVDKKLNCVAVRDLLGCVASTGFARSYSKLNRFRGFGEIRKSENLSTLPTDRQAAGRSGSKISKFKEYSVPPGLWVL